MKYKTRLEIVEAIQWVNSENQLSKIRGWSKAVVTTASPLIWPNIEPGELCLEVKTFEDGIMLVKPNDWVIKDKNGDFYPPCKPDIFEKTYEIVGETTGENEALKLLKKVKNFHEGNGKYNFTQLAPEERDNAYFDAWQEIYGEIKQLLKPLPKPPQNTK